MHRATPAAAGAPGPLRRFLFTVLPYMTASLIEAMIDHSPYQRAGYKRKPAQSHVVITGSFNPSTLKTLLAELVHPDHGTKICHAVILSPKPPSAEIKALVTSYFMTGSIKYIQGSMLRAEVGAQARAADANAASRHLSMHMAAAGHVTLAGCHVRGGA